MVTYVPCVSGNGCPKMEQMDADIRRRPFPLAFDKLVENTQVLKDGLECDDMFGPLDQAARELFGEVFAKAKHGKGRLYYMWRGDVAGKVFPRELDIWVEDEARTLSGRIIFKIRCNDQLMMRQIMLRLFKRFPLLLSENLSEKHRVLVEEQEIVYSFYFRLG